MSDDPAALTVHESLCPYKTGHASCFVRMGQVNGVACHDAIIFLRSSASLTACRLPYNRGAQTCISSTKDSVGRSARCTLSSNQR